MATGRNDGSERGNGIGSGTDPENEKEGLSSDRDQLQARIQALESENERLRAVTRSRLTYRTALVLLVLVAALAVGGTAVYPGARAVLIGIAGIGAFSAVLLGMLVQERFLPASVGQAIYDAMWENEVGIASRLGVAETSRYVPTGGESPEVRLYLSRSLEDPIPATEALTGTTTRIDEHFGLLLEPTGRGFLDLFERTNGELPDRVELVTTRLREAVVQQFELADRVEVVETDLAEESAENRFTVQIWGSVLGDATRLDHPIRSFIAVALARTVNRPVIAEGSTDENGSSTLTFRWSSEPSDPTAAVEPTAPEDEPLEATE